VDLERHRQGLRRLGPDGNANESKQGFLLNHVISEELPPNDAGEHVSNSDPVTGQAGWYDVRVRIYKADAERSEKVSFPQFDTLDAVPGQDKPKKSWLTYFAGGKKRA
jgi:sulfite dehydrogenase (quinone) subunit SoeA